MIPVFCIDHVKNSIDRVKNNASLIIKNFIVSPDWRIEIAVH